MPSQEYSFLHTTNDNSPTVKTKARQQRMIRRSRWKNQEKNTLHHGTGMRAWDLADLQKYFFFCCERIACPLPWFSEFFSRKFRFYYKLTIQCRFYYKKKFVKRQAKKIKLAVPRVVAKTLAGHFRKHEFRFYYQPIPPSTHGAVDDSRLI